MLDQTTKDVLATVLRVQDLREVGVTLHVSVLGLPWKSKPPSNTFCVYRQLHSNRPPLPDVPAIYFVTPTLSNIRRIAEDLERNVYESFHLSFVEPISRSLLEELAALVAKDGTVDLVQQVAGLLLSSMYVSSQVSQGTRPACIILGAFAILIFPSATF